MTIRLTDDQWTSAMASGESPVRIMNPAETEKFVLMRADVYERLLPLIEDVPLTEQERLFQLEQFGKRAGWDDPEMDVYNSLDPRRQP